MKRLHPILAVRAAVAALGLATACAAVAAAVPVSAGVRTVAVDHGALVVRDAAAAFHPLLSGGPGRALPAWSADGTRIAFVQATHRERALADLVVVGRDGRELARVPIEPVTADAAYAGMRAVEGLRWISPTRVAVWGSLNPSQSQYYVIDVASGRTVNDFIDDASSAAFAPGGAHVAFQTGSPHFTPAEQRAPVLMVDGRAVYPAAGRRALEFATPPRWSPDGHSLALFVQNPAHTESMLVVWHDGAVHELPMSVGAADEFDLFWSGSKLLLTAAKAGQPARTAWEADAQGLTLKPVPAQQVVDPLAPARHLREQLQVQAQAAGVHEADFWCADCSLAALEGTAQ
jgi:dipeptidyl aminopeptidase/acylaminoacyl peptidase